MKNNKKIRIIGVPYLYGKDNNLTCDAPKVIRNSGLHRALEIAGFTYKDVGDIQIGKILKENSNQKTNLKYLKEILEITNQVSEEVKTALLAKEIPVLIGGDHSISIGSLLGIASSANDVSLVYIDTHGDFHTSKTTPSGRLHGMALAVSLGLDEKFATFCKSPLTYFDKTKTVLFGAQKFDPGERENIVKNITLIDIPFIVHYGIGKAVDKLLSKIHTKKIYISLDLDAIDKEYAPGTDMAIYGALTYRELIYTLERLAQKYNVIGMDVTEMSPDNDIDGKTASIAIESITTALGKRIGTYELYMEELEPIDKLNPKTS